MELFSVVRPLGWSDDGKFAYMRNSVVDPWCDTCIPDQIVIVQDLVTDEVLYERTIRNGLFNGIGFEGWWRQNADVLARDFAEFGVEMTRSGTAFPGNTFNVAGWDYTVAIQAAAEEREIESYAGPPEPTAVLKDPIVIVDAAKQDASDRSWKTIHRGPRFDGDRGAATSAEIAGAIVGPDGRRAAVIYTWRAAGIEAGDDMTVIGAHLSVGYQTGAPSIAEGATLAESVDARTLLANTVRAQNVDQGIGIDEVLAVAKEVTRAITTKDAPGLNRYLDTETGFYTLTNPGAMIVVEHHFTLPPYLLVGVPPSEGEINNAVTADRVSFIEGTDTLSSLLEWQIEPESYDRGRIEKVETTTTIVVAPRLGVVRRLYFTERDGVLYLTIADLVTPGDA
jgi:hypothetical protein